MNYKILLIGSSSDRGLTFYFTRLALTLKKVGNEVIVLSDGKEQFTGLLNELDSSGIKCYMSDFVDKINIKSMIRGTEDIRRILKRESNFNIAIGGGVKHSVKVFFASRRLNNRPTTFATIGWLPSSKACMSMASISYSLFYDRCVALCNRTMETLTKWGVNPDKIHVIPLFAPNLEWFDEAKEIKINLEDYNLKDVTKPVVFYAAGHYQHKGFRYYLMAASRVLKNFDATFVVGGSGQLTDLLKNLAEKLRISKHVVFTGRINIYHMPHVLSKIADVCVSTSLVEQLPSYIMECMAAGKPVVASSVGGVSEIVSNEVNGYLVPPHDYEETAHRITDLLINSEKAEKMGFNGRKIIKEQLNMKISVMKLMKVYEKSIRG